MIQLSDEQLHNLGKEALIIIVSSLQDQLHSLQSQLDHANAQLSDTNRQIELLTEQIRIMNQRHFGRKSEANLSEIDGQISLFDSFNEAEYLNQNSAKEPEIEEIVISSYRRSKAKGKREADLDGIPARIIEHRLSDEELAAKFPNGYKELPMEVYKRLHIIPETFIVDEHHVHVYASKSNDGTILKAPRPRDLFRNSIATPALVASIINGKYTNALPLERQAKTYKMNGINLATNTMANWVIRSTDIYLSLIYDRMHELIYDSKVIHADETPVKVMRIDNAKIKNGKKTYMWVYRNRPFRGTHPIVLYDWQDSRRSDHPREFLKTFSGTVVTDGYQVYHKLEKEREDLKVAGCWIHTRRPFADFIKSVGLTAAKGSIAQEAYDMITEMLRIDNTFDDLPVSDRKKQRQLVLSEKVDAYFAWIKQKYAQVTPNGSIGKALAYSINQEKHLRVFLSDGNIPMDNNYAEQAIRPFTLGRKNFVLIESSNGAKSSAVLYSLVETAKANGLNTFEYFNLLLTEIPQHMDESNLGFLDDLLPWSPRVQKTCPSKYKKS
ncbi:IS66 family transposase [Clostridiaceae bacterium Marseille-Q4143]|nr:IS66 family transposase [Clostridiaceae bacterium Marseille-Q4143]